MVVSRARPSGSKVSILRNVHWIGPPEIALVLSSSASHRHIFQVIFGNRDGGEFGEFSFATRTYVSNSTSA